MAVVTAAVAAASPRASRALRRSVIREGENPDLVSGPEKTGSRSRPSSRARAGARAGAGASSSAAPDEEALLRVEPTQQLPASLRPPHSTQAVATHSPHSPHSHHPPEPAAAVTAASSPSSAAQSSPHYPQHNPEQSFEDNVSAVRRFHSRHRGKYPKKRGKREGEEEICLARFLQEQRRHWLKGRLAPARVAALSALPAFSWGDGEISKRKKKKETKDE